MKAFLSVILVLSALTLWSGCEQKTCPCPDVILDTQLLKFQSHVTVTMTNPTLTSANAAIMASGWTTAGQINIFRTYFALPSLAQLDAKYKIRAAHFVWYGDVVHFDDRIDDDTSFIYVTAAPANTILNINWNNQPTILQYPKIPIPPPYHRIGKIKIEATDIVNKIRNGTIGNNVFLFRLRNETIFRHKTYKGVNTITQEEAPALELILESPVDS